MFFTGANTTEAGKEADFAVKPAIAGHNCTKADQIHPYPWDVSGYVAPRSKMSNENSGIKGFMTRVAWGLQLCALPPLL